jgi:Family of unknown function (DUF5691)
MSGTLSPQERGQLRQAMFLGLARQPLIVPERLHSLIVPASEREPALTVLALAGQRQRFERPIVERSADGIPEAARRLHEDQRPVIPDATRRLFLRLVDGVEKGLADAVVRTAVRRVMRAGFRPHPFDLPRLIDRIKGDARCLGLAERAYLSLADLSSKPDAPSALHAEITTDNWTEFPKGHRVAFLREERRRDPVAARALLERVYKSEPAAVRADLLTALDVGLGANDLPFLDGLSADRSENVRNIASRLTSKVPGTPAFAARLAEAARCFVRNAHGARTILTRAGLASSGNVVFAPPKTANPAELRAALASLFNGFSVAEIAAAAALDVAEVMAALPADEETVLTVFADRAVQDDDEGTMIRLVAHGIAKIDARRSSVAPMLAWLAQNLTGPAHVEFGKSLLGSPTWQTAVERLAGAATPAAMKDDGTLIWTAAVLPSQLLPTFREATAALMPATTRSARDFADLMLTLNTLQPRQG